MGPWLMDGGGWCWGYLLTFFWGVVGQSDGWFMLGFCGCFVVGWFCLLGFGSGGWIVVFRVFGCVFVGWWWLACWEIVVRRWDESNDGGHLTGPHS